MCLSLCVRLPACLHVLHLRVCVPPIANVLQVLEEAQDVVEADDCLDIISWLEHNSPLLSTYKTGNTQVGEEHWMYRHMHVHAA